MATCVACTSENLSAALPKSSLKSAGRDAAGCAGEASGGEQRASGEHCRCSCSCTSLTPPRPRPPATLRVTVPFPTRGIIHCPTPTLPAPSLTAAPRARNPSPIAEPTATPTPSPVIASPAGSCCCTHMACRLQYCFPSPIYLLHACKTSTLLHAACTCRTGPPNADAASHLHDLSTRFVERAPTRPPASAQTCRLVRSPQALHPSAAAPAQASEGSGGGGGGGGRAASASRQTLNGRRYHDRPGSSCKGADSWAKLSAEFHPRQGRSLLVLAPCCSSQSLLSPRHVPRILCWHLCRSAARRDTNSQRPDKRVGLGHAMRGASMPGSSPVARRTRSAAAKAAVHEPTAAPPPVLPAPCPAPAAAEVHAYSNGKRPREDEPSLNEDDFSCSICFGLLVVS